RHPRAVALICKFLTSYLVDTISRTRNTGNEWREHHRLSTDSATVDVPGRGRGTAFRACRRTPGHVAAAADRADQGAGTVAEAAPVRSFTPGHAAQPCGCGHPAGGAEIFWAGGATGTR